MAAPNPYETDDFLGLRASQRRAVRQIPEWIMQGYVERHAEPIVREPDGLAETELRADAVRIAAGFPAETIDRLMAHGAAEHYLATLRGLPELSEIEAGSTWSEVQRHAATIHREATIGDLDALGVDADQIWLWIHILRCADAVASDGYRDPHFAEGRLAR